MPSTTSPAPGCTARHHGHPTVVDRVSVPIEERQVDPREVRAIAGRPDDGADSRLRHVAVTPALPGPHRRRGRDSRGMLPPGHPDRARPCARRSSGERSAPAHLPIASFSARSVAKTAFPSWMPRKRPSRTTPSRASVYASDRARHRCRSTEGWAAPRGPRAADRRPCARTSPPPGPVRGVLTAVAARHPPAAGDREIDAAPGASQVLSDLAARLAAADDQHRAGR